MRREPLLQQLRAYRDRWPAETATADRLIEFVERHPDCFERALEVGHVTGSAWLLNRAQTRVLLTHHRKLDIWVQLGGHTDGNADVLDSARREAVEESGIAAVEPINLEIFDIDIHLIPARKTEPAHYHHDIRYAFRTVDSDEYVVSDESHDLAWVDVQRIADYTNEASMLRMADKWLTR